jgi:hypothetical protein
VVSDGAAGIGAAVRRLPARDAEGRAPVHGLDLFHTLRDAGPPLRAAWRRAEEAFAAGEAADAKVAACRRRGTSATGAAATAGAAWRKAERLLADADRQGKACARAGAALGMFRPDGELNDAAWARAEIAAATAELPGPEWRKARSSLADPRTAAFLERMGRRLEAAEPDAALRRAMVWRWRLRRRPEAARADKAAGAALATVEAVARERPPAGEEAAAYGRVAAVLATTVRASSCVEGMNSVLRMQQCRHRKMTQGMLDLKRLYWNTRPFATGRRRKRSPYQLLGLELPTHDFWRLLNGDPARLTAQLSTAKAPP